MRFSALLIVTLFLTSCASYTPGSQAKRTKGTSQEQVSVTAKIDSNMSLDDFLFVNFYFSNYGSEWARIKNIEIVSIKDHPDARVIVGKDLYYWGKSMEHKLAVDAYNRDIMYGSLALLGAGVALAGGSSGSKPTARLGAALATGAIVFSEVQNILDNISELERTAIVPENHLFSPFTVPPHLTTNKWILFQKMNAKNLCMITFRITYIDDKTATFDSRLSDRCSYEE